MKSVLIISPAFPPVNTAEMHRIRHSVPYFKEFGWNPVVVAVMPEFIEAEEDALLLESIPNDTEVHRVKALPACWTRRIGLGSLALRSFYFYKRAVDRLLMRRRIDLIYFSTTMFPLAVLGSYWKRKFGIPYIIDFQDPWFTDYYLSEPRHRRPKKFWFSYRLDKWLEPVAMKSADGVVAVTSAYCRTMQERYGNIKEHNSVEIPFGASQLDCEIARRSSAIPPFIFCEDMDIIRGVYTGVCNTQMQPIVEEILRAWKMGLDEYPELFGRVRLYFVGTNYIKGIYQRAMIEPIAERYGLLDKIVEIKDRMSYFSAIKLQQECDFLVLIGSVDANYTASKVYPYVMAQKPILAVFNRQSNIFEIVRQIDVTKPVTFGNDQDLKYVTEDIYDRWREMLMKLPFIPETNWEAFERYTAKEMAKRQVAFFDKILAGSYRTPSSK